MTPGLLQAGLDRLPAFRALELPQFHQPVEFNPPPLSARMEERGDRTFKILSLDGGGIRGIIPLKILTSLEGFIGPISETFDLISGTSTGGIISLGLTASRQRLRAQDILEIYQNRAQEIFLPNPKRVGYETAIKFLPRLLPGQETIIQGLIDHPRYTDAGVQRLANGIFGDSLMKDTRTNVFIPSVDISNIHQPFTQYFTNRKREHAFLAIQDVVAATSAAPTYFPYKKIGGATYVDGGLSCNNPAKECCWHALSHGIPPGSFQVLSLGTGFADMEGIPEAGNHNLFYWAKRIFPTMNATLSSTVDRDLRECLGDRYWRINPGLQREIDLADHSQETLIELNDIGNRLVEDQIDNIRALARLLRPAAF